MGRVFGGVFWGRQIKGDSVFPDRLKLIILKKKLGELKLENANRFN